MRYAALAVFALGLAACGHADQTPTPKVDGPVATLPPNLFQDCIEYTLLDDSCTRTWYECRLGQTDHGSCVQAWEECCTLRGQGSRSRLASAAPVDR